MVDVMLEKDPAAARERLAAAQEQLGEGLDELRELARGIHPAILTDRGLGPALEGLVARAPVPVEITELPEERLAAPVEAAAYYVVAEAITNVAKYAQASNVTVSVRRSNGHATVVVADDGVGGADPALGTGLRGLADRLEALDGRLQVEAPPRAAPASAPRSPAPDRLTGGSTPSLLRAKHGRPPRLRTRLGASRGNRCGPNRWAPLRSAWPPHRMMSRIEMMPAT